MILMSKIETPQMPRVSLQVKPDVQPRFTTLLQSGIFLVVPQGTTICNLLLTLPGFTAEYIRDRVETVFLNGLPADNMNQKLFGKTAVLALSAAMPGLAGAIFRKGGVHASLRTETATEHRDTNTTRTPVQIRLKLFNIIAVARGALLLSEGCLFSASALIKFLDYRPPLLKGILHLSVNKQAVSPNMLADKLPMDTIIHLQIRSTDERC